MEFSFLSNYNLKYSCNFILNGKYPRELSETKYLVNSIAKKNRIQIP